MKKLTLKIIVFVVLLYIPLYAVQYVVDNGMKKYRKGEYGVWNDIYAGKINADLLILGTSRAFVNISPLVLDTALKQQAYNLGMDGAEFNLVYTRFKVYLAHNKNPKTVIISLSPSDMERALGIFNHQQFMPYLNDKLLRNGISGYVNSFNLADEYVPAMKYRSNPVSYPVGFKLFFNQPVQADELRVKGYEPRDRKWDDSFDNFKKLNRTYNIKTDSGLVKELHELISYCKSNNIKLYMVYSPEYIKVQPYFVNRPEIFSYYTSAAKKYDVPFLDYSNDPMSYDTAYFYNSEHLNTYGSETFTKKLAQDIKTLNLQ